MLGCLDSKQALCKVSAGLAGTENRKGLARTEYRKVACESAGLAGTEYRKVACESAGLAGVALETVDGLRPRPGGSRAPSSVGVNKGATWIQTSIFLCILCNAQCARGRSSSKSCKPPIIEAQSIGGKNRWNTSKYAAIELRALVVFERLHENEASSLLEFAGNAI